MRAIAQERVLTTGGATRLVDRMEMAGLVAREEKPGDRRGRLVRPMQLGEATLVRTARLHVANVQRFLRDPLPAEQGEQFTDGLRTVSLAASNALPRLR